jgi:Glycosyl-4,4'-diaponeurosporenoate acyltransferase
MHFILQSYSKLIYTLISAEEKESIKIRRSAAIFNMIPNLVWTALFLVPVTIFCYTLVNHNFVFILLGMSMIPIFFPNSFFDALQLSRNSAFYKRIGVKYINKFAQNGTLLNQYLRNRYPKFKPVSTNRSSIAKQYHQTYFFEKFHFSLFIFFTVVIVYALVKNYLLWALILSICNLFYNIYPNLLQQYIRLKLELVIKRS